MMSIPARLRTNGSVRLPAFAALLLTLSCSQLVYQPGAVVPTASPLPYSAMVRLTGIAQPVSKAKKDWERSIADYLAARKTFTYLSTDSQTDLDLTMRLHIYIDPSVDSDFHHVYVARIDATLAEASGKRALSKYIGFGKATGEEDRGPINLAVQAALNDLFGKIETDQRLRKYRL